MKLHTKIYMTWFGYTTADFIPCEIPACIQRAVDVCHINSRGMGGNPSGDKNVIENLMGKCRYHHNLFGDKKQHMEYLTETHRKFMESHAKD